MRTVAVEAISKWGASLKPTAERGSWGGGSSCPSPPARGSGRAL